MKNLIVFGAMILSFSCTKSKSTINNTFCGTPGWPHGKWKIKFEISGNSIPDSIQLMVGGGGTSTNYFRKIYSSSLPLSDSTFFCGDVNSDICIFLSDKDTSKVYTCKIFIDDTLATSITGKSVLPPYWLSTVAQCK